MKINPNCNCVVIENGKATGRMPCLLCGETIEWDASHPIDTKPFPICEDCIAWLRKLREETDENNH